MDKKPLDDVETYAVWELLFNCPPERSVEALQSGVLKYVIYSVPSKTKRMSEATFQSICSIENDLIDEFVKTYGNVDRVLVSPKDWEYQPAEKGGNFERLMRLVPRKQLEDLSLLKPKGGKT